MTEQIRFDDGEGYERYMGRWSQLAGQLFLDWLAPPPGLRWLDVGCGNGAFTEMLVERCAPAAVTGVDPSEAQLAFARARHTAGIAEFRQGDAMALPFEDRSFDAAVMPLVIFFVPDPPRGVAEMARVVGPGGLVCAYGWDLSGGGHPYESLLVELRALGVTVPWPPSPDAASLDALTAAWTAAGLAGVETHVMQVTRTFESFDDYWTTIGYGASVSKPVASLSADDMDTLKSRMRARLATDADGRIRCRTRAHAVKGRTRG
jgi:SAM-dependent methyltransferase